jgi:hypothetical protein
MFQRINLPILLLLIGTCQWVSAVDWINAPSYFTHDPQTGKPTSQYAPTPEVQIYQDPTYVKSGYRHYRSTLRGNGSADNLHIVKNGAAKCVRMANGNALTALTRSLIHNGVPLSKVSAQSTAAILATLTQDRQFHPWFLCHRYQFRNMRCDGMADRLFLGWQR